MRNNQTTFTTRRGVNYSESAQNWTRSRNSSRTRNGMSKISYGVIVGMLTLAVGLIYVGQGTTASGYDYQISEIENSITELQIQKEDLAVEQARLTSLATAETSEVAMSMEDGTAAGYAAE